MEKRPQSRFASFVSPRKRTNNERKQKGRDCRADGKQKVQVRRVIPHTELLGSYFQRRRYHISSRFQSALFPFFPILDGAISIVIRRRLKGISRQMNCSRDLSPASVNKQTNHCADHKTRQIATIIVKRRSTCTRSYPKSQGKRDRTAPRHSLLL